MRSRTTLLLGVLLLTLGCGLGARRCNPPNTLPTHFPGDCPEPGTACSEEGSCEPCGQLDEICCAGNRCGLDRTGTQLRCLPPPILAPDARCR